MKILRWIAWIALAVAGIIIILALISLGKPLFGFTHSVNYFIAADSFALVAIALFIATKNCCCCDSKDEKKEN